jgi:hypothetical protein
MCTHNRVYARGGRLLATCTALAAVAMVCPRGQAAEPGPMSLSPARVAAEEVASAELATMARQAAPDESVSAAKPTETPPTTEPAQPPATQPEESAWPPGLLQDVLYAVGLKDPMKDLGLRAYGYVDFGFTGRIKGGQSTHQGNRQPVLFLRSFDAHNFNNLLLNQLKFTLDRPVDTSKAFDLGGRADFIYGSDARYTRAYGLFNNDVYAQPPFRNNNDPNPFPFNVRELSDLTQFYGEAWIRTGQKDQGIDIIGGKWYTPIGFEVVDPVGNYLYSHSMLFQYAEPFTHTGVKATYSFNATNNVYFAFVRGWDVFKDNNEGASWMSGFLWSSKSQVGSNPRTSLAFNTIVGPEQFSDPRISGHRAWHAQPGNRVLLDAVWTYRFTEKLTQVICSDFGYEDNVPGATNHLGISRTRDSDWEGIAYYLNYVFNDYVNATGRAEWFRDHYGVRTGFPGNFFGITTGVNITPCPKDKYLKNLLVRPELRWDFSSNNEPFAGRSPGSGECQMTAAIDMIYKF